MQELYLADDLMPLVASKEKLATCRYKFRDIFPGQLRLRAANGTHADIVVNVYAVTHTAFDRLSLKDVQNEASDHGVLFDSMRNFYPDFRWDSPVTLIKWD